jgi:hypothetical protein
MSFQGQQRPNLLIPTLQTALSPTLADVQPPSPSAADWPEARLEAS